MLAFILSSILWAGAAAGLDDGPRAAGSIRLKPVFTLGHDPGDQGQFFTTGTTVVLDRASQVWVSDPGNFRLAVFNLEGRLLREFGRRGQGPGEFERPGPVALDAEGRIALFDPGRKCVMRFDGEGRLISETRFEPGIQSVLPAPAFLADGSLLMASVKTDANFQIGYDLSLYDGDMRSLANLIAIPLPSTDWSRMEQPGFWVRFLREQFERLASGLPLGAVVNGSSLATATSDRYMIALRDGAGRPRHVMQRAIRPIPVTEETRRALFTPLWGQFVASPFGPNLAKPVFEQALAAAEVPDVLPPLTALVSLDDGFAVLTGYRPDRGQGKLEFFDGAGSYLGGADYRGPSEALYGKGDRLFAVGLDREDNIVVHGWRVEGLSAAEIGGTP